MSHWSELSTVEPALAAQAVGLLERSGVGEGLLATIDGAGLPRIHPVYVKIIGGRLLTAVLAGSVKRVALEHDGRYALHAHQDPAVPHELLIRGRASPVTDPTLRATAVAAWPFEVSDDDGLFELGVEHVILGERPTADAWPPVYRSWRPPRA